jgi:hypothetical protein
MANDSSNETHRFSTYLTVPTDCKRHEFARQAVQGNKVRPCGRVSLLLFCALKVVVNCQNVCAMASEWRLVGEVEHNLDVVVESVETLLFLARDRSFAIPVWFAQLYLHARSLKAMRDLPNARASR